MFSQHRLVIRPSRYLAFACILLHLLLAAAMGSTGPKGCLIVAYSLLLTAHCTWWLWHYILLRSHCSLIALCWTPAGFALEWVGQRYRKAQLLPRSFISPYLMVLHFRVMGQSSWWPLILILASDSGDSNQQRRLRVFARYQSAAVHQLPTVNGT